MQAYTTALTFLPPTLQQPLSAVGENIRQQVQEIRLRRGGALMLSTPFGEKCIDTYGKLTDFETAHTVYPTAEEIEKTFLRVCDYSVHSHTAELCDGYVTAAGGFRVGVAGTAVMQDGQVTAVRDIRSLCIRIAARHDGCAAALYPLYARRMTSLLIAGEPSCGKTSMLRDLARVLTAGKYTKRYRLAIVDERAEIGDIPNADILTGFPKPQGILQAVRTLAPDGVMFDELGTVEETAALTANLHSGVPAIATAHCRNLQECRARPAVRLALERGVFQKIVFLQGRHAPGKICEIVEVTSHENGGFVQHYGGGNLPVTDRHTTQNTACHRAASGNRAAL